MLGSMLVAPLLYACLVCFVLSFLKMKMLEFIKF